MNLEILIFIEFLAKDAYLVNFQFEQVRLPVLFNDL